MNNSSKKVGKQKINGIKAVKTRNATPTPRKMPRRKNRVHQKEGSTLGLKRECPQQGKIGRQPTKKRPKREIKVKDSNNSRWVKRAGSKKPEYQEGTYQSGCGSARQSTN